jgi:radical SAM protein with 4Fe4S-binding SPASM domain
MFSNHKVKPFYNPPTLLARQAASALYFGLVTRWRKLPYWFTQVRKTIPTAAGATGMGCIGFPVHPVWEVTSACNLRCRQCHASGGKVNPDELTTEEGKKLLRELSEITDFRMLVLAGGEPLVRKDILELTFEARNLGFEVSIATNGTLLDSALALEFKRMKVANIAIGLNAVDEHIHDGITGVPGSFEKTRRAIHYTKELGMNLQINTTVMKENAEYIPDLLDFASEVGAQIVLLYHLTPVGRGEREMELSTREYQGLVEMVAGKQKKSKSIIEPVCAPQYWAYLTKRSGVLRTLAQTFFKGCVAGKGLCYIKPNGDVWACPFIPISAGNVRQNKLKDIWEKSSLFELLRDRGNLKGKCGGCSYKEICGGCRGRAYAHYGDFLAEDPLCFMPTQAKR